MTRIRKYARVPDPPAGLKGTHLEQWWRDGYYAFLCVRFRPPTYATADRLRIWADAWTQAYHETIRNIHREVRFPMGTSYQECRLRELYRQFRFTVDSHTGAHET